MAADIARQLEGPNETWRAIMEREMEIYRETAELVEAAEDAASAVEDTPDTGQAEPMTDER